MGKRFISWKNKVGWSVMFPLFIVVLVVTVALLTGVKSTYRVYSDTVQQITAQMEGDSFLYFLERENILFREAGPDHTSMAKGIMELVMDLKLDDARSLFGNAIPGLKYYHDRIIVAGEGTDYTNLPVESEPPLTVLEEERQARDDIKEPAPSGTADPQVFIYHTHNRESFLPHLASGTKDNEAYHNEMNVTQVGKRLGNELQARGVAAKVDAMDVTAVLKRKGWRNYRSYDATRSMVEETLASHSSISYVFDIHRDSIDREHTTMKLKGQSVARTMFVVGAEHGNYEKNLAVATELHQMFEKKYPGLSRGVITKRGAGVNGVYNQDLHPKSLVVEMGGKDNTFEELNRTASMFAEVLRDYIDKKE